MSSRPIVIKIGGEVAGSGEAALLAADLKALWDEGDYPRIAIVHGGGPQATALQKQLGLETKQVAGRRVTDAATLDVMKMAVAGKLNVDLCATLQAAGLSAVGLHGASGLVVRAMRRPPRIYAGAGDEPVDMGFVGDVVGFNLDLLETLWSGGHIPVIACLGADASGGVYNINADMVGNQLAAALKAERLFLVTSTPGVLKDIKDPNSRLTRLTVAEARQAITDGVVTGGMIPKLEEAMAVVDQGVGAIHILGKLAAGDLIRAVREPGSVGTTLVDS
ncbi:MAG: acetylglutamate kinase [Myxococcota bacterium]|nr:acetylglutamate kinase [Deltaproteobacteria bacterium]MDQ3340220.1 acetylglutamate kinase [Myxococcota bacterium]